MSVYRSFAGRQGVSIPARNSAKLKTLVQDFSIAFCVLPPTAHLHGLQLATIWLACALTLFTGAQYYFDGRRALHGGRREDRGRRRRHGAAARPDRRHQLDVARRADGRGGRGLALPPGRRRQSHPDRGRAAHRAGARRRRDRLRGPRAHPGRHHARRHRRGHERGPRARRGDGGDHRRLLRGTRAPDVAQQRAPGRRTGGGAVIPQTRGTAPGLICPSATR